MKLKRYTPEYLKYWHNKEEIDIPEYRYRESDVRGCWISNVANIDTPRGLSIEEYKKPVKSDDVLYVVESLLISSFSQ